MDIKKIIITVITINFISCTQHENVNSNKTQMNKDPFYTENSGYDYIRLPLVKPYELISLDKGNIWGLEGQPKPKLIKEDNTAFGIKKIEVKSGIILCYCEGHTMVGGEKFDRAWYVFIPEQNINKGFATEQEFITYLQTKGIQKEPIEWDTPEKLFEQFSNTHCLPWIPDCN